MSFGSGIKKLAKEISARYKYLRGKKGVLENPHQDLKQWQPDGAWGKTGRVAGLVGIDLTWFLFCLMKYTVKDTKNTLNSLLLDNAIIDKWEKSKKNIKTEKNDSSFQRFFKNLQKSHPRAVATLQLWMVYALMTMGLVGGRAIYDNRDDIKQNLEELPSDKEQEESVYDVYDTKFKEKFVEENWGDVVICLLEYETWRSVPKQQSGESRYTYGPGLTWVYVNGKQHKCVGKYVKMASGFTEEQIWNQVRQHCLYPGECLSLIQKGFKECGIKHVTKQQVLSLFVAGYQIPSRLRDGTATVTKKNKKGKKIKEKIPYVGIIRKLTEVGTDTQKIVDSFIAGNEVELEYLDGTNKRRWWCAMHYIGKINTENLLSMDMDAFSKVEIDSIMKDGCFVYDDETIMYALSQQKPSNETVQEFIGNSIWLNNMEMLCTTNCKPHYYKFAVFNQKDKNISKKKSKKIAFNEGIMKIKNKQKNNTVVYPFDNEYRA